MPSMSTASSSFDNSLRMLGPPLARITTPRAELAVASLFGEFNFGSLFSTIFGAFGGGRATGGIVSAGRDPKTGAPTELDGRWTVVWQKQGAGWKIVHIHWSSTSSAK